MLNEALHVLSDPAHMLAEFFWEFTFLLLGVGISRWQTKREHRKHHEETQPKQDKSAFASILFDEPIPYHLTDLADKEAFRG